MSMSEFVKSALEFARSCDGLIEVDGKDGLFVVEKLSKGEMTVFVDLRNGFSYYGYRGGEVVKEGIPVLSCVNKVRSHFFAKGCMTLDSFTG